MEYLIYAAIGLGAGLLGGLLGVGGSIVMIPALTEVFGPRQHLYQAAAMIVNFFVVLPAVHYHVRAQAVQRAVVSRLAPTAVVSVILGVLASEWPGFKGRGEAYLTILFGLFIFLLGVQNVVMFLRAGGDPSTRAFDPVRDRWRAALGAGVPTGFVAGLLGVGGGVICVPLQNRFLGIPLRNAIANSAATILALCLVGAATKNYALAAGHTEYTLGQSLGIAAALAPTALVGGLLGARLVHRLPVRAIRFVLIVFLVVAAVRMVDTGRRELRATPPSAADVTLAVLPADSAD